MYIVACAMIKNKSAFSEIIKVHRRDHLSLKCALTHTALGDIYP